MKQKGNISVGIDGITVTCSGDCGLTEELKLPEENPVLHLRPKRNSCEIGVVISRTVRNDNNIGYRVVDTKNLNETIQTITRLLKKHGIKKDLCDLYVTQVEVACTVDLGRVEKRTVDGLMNFFSRIFLQDNKVNVNDNKPNKILSNPLIKYSSGERKNGCVFIKDEIVNSMETSLWSNRRLKWKCYSKGAYSEFGGNTSIFRLEAVYVEKGIKHVLKKDMNTVSLADILKQSVIKAFISQFKQDYCEIILPVIRGWLSEATELVYENLCRTSAYNTLLISKEFLYDIRIFQKALKKWYKDQNKSDGAYRKINCCITKKMKQNKVMIPEGVIAVLEDMSKAMK